MPSLSHHCLFIPSTAKKNGTEYSRQGGRESIKSRQGFQERQFTLIKLDIPIERERRERGICSASMVVALNLARNTQTREEYWTDLNIHTKPRLFATTSRYLYILVQSWSAPMRIWCDYFSLVSWGLGRFTIYNTIVSHTYTSTSSHAQGICKSGRIFRIYNTYDT